MCHARGRQRTPLPTVTAESSQVGPFELGHFSPYRAYKGFVMAVGGLLKYKLSHIASYIICSQDQKLVLLTIRWRLGEKQESPLASDATVVSSENLSCEGAPI